MELPLLNSSLFFIIDDECYEKVKNYNWSITKEGYVRRSNCGRKEERFLHRFILNATKDYTVDHKNRNPLDNRKENLRMCTNQQNHFNRKKLSGKSSAYKGVTWDKERNKWKVNIMINGASKTVGRYEDEIEAALAYNEKARELFGEFAYINIID